MQAGDDEFYWDWYKHEESLSTNRGSFFLLGQSMLFAGYGALRVSNSRQSTTAISIFCGLGIFAACIWLLLSALHFRFTQTPLIQKLNMYERRRAEISGVASSGWHSAFRSYNLMGIYLPIGILVSWVLLLLI